MASLRERGSEREKEADAAYYGGEWVPVSDAARHLGIDRMILYRLLYRGAPSIPGPRGRRLVSVTELSEWMDARG